MMPRTLSSSSFARSKTASDSRRVQKVEEYINLHYTQEIRLSQLAELTDMTPVSYEPIFQIKNRKKSVGLYYRYTFGACDKTVGRFDENGCRNML